MSWEDIGELLPLVVFVILGLRQVLVKIARRRDENKDRRFRRGYEPIEVKLGALGASVERIR